MQGNEENDKSSHWDNVYLTKSFDQVSWYQSEPTTSFDLIESTGLRKQQRIIDVGVGVSQLPEKLLKSGYKKLTLLDLSRNALNLQREKLGKFEANVDYINADISNIELDFEVSLWHDRAALHFLTSRQEREAYLYQLNKNLVRGGYFVLSTFAKGGPKKCSGLRAKQFDAESIQQELGNGYSLISNRTENHLTPWNSEQLFNYFLFKKSS